MYLEVKGLKKTIDDFNIELDFSVKEGEFLSLLGPSGCGKTTTLRMLSGFISPDEGRIIMADKDLTNSSPQTRNTGIVFQDYALFPGMNVEKNIAYGPKVRKFNRTEINKIVRETMGFLDLQDFEKRSVLSLSGGEQQRVALGRALAVRPKLLLLDEPLSALDAGLRKVLRKEIRKVQQNLGITTIYITHDQEEAISISDRIALMKNGRILEIASPEKLYREPENIFSAEFIGNSNIFDGSVESIKDKICRIKTSIGNIQAFCNGDVKPEDSVKIFFRPESCRIITKTSAQNNLNTFKAEVLYREYLGKDFNIEVSVNNESVLINNSSDINIIKGDIVQFSIDPCDCRIYRNQ